MVTRCSPACGHLNALMRPAIGSGPPRDWTSLSGLVSGFESPPVAWVHEQEAHGAACPHGALCPFLAAIESFSFVISSLTLEHQNEVNSLDLIVQYQYEVNLHSYPDFREMAIDVERTLRDYRKPTHSWERLNKAVARSLLDHFPMIVLVRVTMMVAPSVREPYDRWSVVEIGK